MSERSKTGALQIDDARVEIAGGDGENVGVVDVRSEDDFGEGHIPGATNVPGGNAEEVRSAFEDRDEVGRWLVVCDDGEQSAQLVSELAEGEVEVAYLDGGMKAWIKKDLPAQPPASDQEFEGPKATTLY